MTDGDMKKLVTVNGEEYILTSTFDCDDDSNNFHVLELDESKKFHLLKVDHGGNVTLLTSLDDAGQPDLKKKAIGRFKWASDASWKFEASEEGVKLGLPKEDEEVFSWSLVIIEKQWALKHIEVLFGDFQKLMESSS